jgi:hypothetical protein
MYVAFRGAVNEIKIHKIGRQTVELVNYVLCEQQRVMDAPAQRCQTGSAPGPPAAGLDRGSIVRKATKTETERRGRWKERKKKLKQEMGRRTIGIALAEEPAVVLVNSQRRR